MKARHPGNWVERENLARSLSAHSPRVRRDAKRASRRKDRKTEAAEVAEQLPTPQDGTP